MAEWTVYTLAFDTQPSLEAWEIFCARAAGEFDCQGIEDQAVGPREALPAVPPTAKLYFPPGGHDHLSASLEALADDCFGGRICRIAHAAVPVQDWGKAWRQYFHTMRVGERLWVGPPWEGNLPPDAPAGAILITIEPGQAFGTGSHETTRLCMRMLERCVAPGSVILDVGAGSGILSFAALKLGSKFAIAMENDPVCEENLYINAEHNGVRSRVAFLLSGDVDDVRDFCDENGHPMPDFVVCNMLSEQFTPLMPSLRRLGLPVLFSGFLMSEAEVVRSELRRAKFAVTDADDLDEWGAFLCEPVAKG